jgi:hypothetical protein
VITVSSSGYSSSLNILTLVTPAKSLLQYKVTCHRFQELGHSHLGWEESFCSPREDLIYHRTHLSNPEQ